MRHGQAQADSRLIHLLIGDLCIGKQLEQLFLLLRLDSGAVVLYHQVQNTPLIADTIVRAIEILGIRGLIKRDLLIFRVKISLELPPIVQKVVCLFSFL